VVRQRLRLASVSEQLLAIYAEDGMSLEQLMAFTVTTDHARQEKAWEAISKSWSKEPYQIRRMLTERAVQASDKRVVFIGLDAYEVAGGSIMRDLFAEENGAWLEDVGLLERLVTEKLTAEAEAIAAEGWKWVQVAPEFPYGHARGLRELDGTPMGLSAEEQASREALREEHEKLEAEHGAKDEIPEDVYDRLEEIERALDAFEDRPRIYSPADIARAGVFVSIDGDGWLLVDRAYVRPEDEAPAGDTEIGSGAGRESDTDERAGPPAVQRAVITISGEDEPEEDEGDGIKPLPDRLVMELTAHRTLALRDAVANNPHVAMTALLHKLCLDTFRHSASGTCLEASVKHVFFPVQAENLKDSASAKSITERHEAWKADVPKDESTLWDWLAGLDDASRAALLAHCVSYGVNALYEKADRYGGGAITAHGVQQRLHQADRLARAVGLDMVDAGWRPSVENYLGRVTKPRILQAVREAKGVEAAQLIDHLKKADMAKEAERLLDGTGWLPKPLRLVDIDADASGAEALPEFLDEDDEGAEEEGEDPHR